MTGRHLRAIRGPLSRPVSARFAAIDVVFRDLFDVSAILLDESFDSLSAPRALDARVRDRTTEPNIIAYEILSVRLGAKLLDVRLLHFVVTGPVAAVMRLVPF
jgi:hypothetical protein